MTRELVDRFYTAFAATDGEAMAACYGDGIVFEDPAFGELHGKDAGDMWRMLCGRAADLRVSHTVLDASEASATVNWIADYTFSTGRPVRNDVTATMKIRDGQIVDHRDVFDVWKWSRQALGVPGLLLGWSPPLQSKIRATAVDGLRKYQAETD